MRNWAIVATMALCMALPACRSGDAPAAQASDKPASAAGTSSVTNAPSLPAASARKVEEDNDLYSFSYSYPAEAAAIPALKAQLDAELDEARSGIASDAKAGRDEARGSGFDFIKYDRSAGWSVVTNIPGWLSLSGGSYEFTGGAHGNSSSAALLWDKAAGRRREPMALFLSKEAFNAAAGAAFCAALTRERSKRREMPVSADSGDEYDRCLDPADLTVLLGSSDKVRFNRIGIIADPYVAGPYAEGEYEITIVVTPAVLQAVKPEYRQYFATGR